MSHNTTELAASFLNFTATYELTNGQTLSSQSTVGEMLLTFADDLSIGSAGNEVIGGAGAANDARYTNRKYRNTG